nr:phosphotransferase [Streptomyces boncukensis]
MIGTETLSRRVRLSDGRRVLVRQYRAMADLERIRAAWEMSELCRVARVPVPRAWRSWDGEVLTSFADAAWVVSEEALGRVVTEPMTVARAQHIGLMLGRMHRALVACPPPAHGRPARWHTADAESAAACSELLLIRAAAQHNLRLDQLNAQLDQRRRDLRTHVPRLRAGLPGDLVAHAAHGDFTRTNLLAQEDLITAILGFHGEVCVLAWELGRAAFDPRTVANSPSWMRFALRLIGAYRAENPGLPLADLRACARIALLDLLFSFDGATTGGHRRFVRTDADARQRWAECQITIRRLLASLDDLESALVAVGRGS